MKKGFKNFPSLGRGVRGEGFTLAEVLITLMIIGIVAALTIPSVISNYQQQEFKTGLKKAVSVLNEAIQTNIAQDGETPYENQNLYDYLTRHMSVIKSVIVPSVQFSGHNHAFYTADGMRFEISEAATLGLKLHESNTVAGLRNYNRNGYVSSCETGGQEGAAWEAGICQCGSYGLENNYHNTTKPPCVVLVDINGDKKPNPPVPFVYGKIWSVDCANTTSKYLYPSPTDKKITDIFNILITEDRAIPFGVVAQRAMYRK